MEQTVANAAQLSVAEALVLQDPNKEQGRAALKLTMMELLARGILTLRHEESKGRLGRTRKTEYVEIGADAAKRVPHYPHVRVVLDTIRSASMTGSGTTMQRLVVQARKVFGSDLSRFRSHYVMPALVQRGLLEAYEQKVLFVFSKSRYRHTPAGESVLQQLQARLAQARGIPSMLDTNPAEVVALVAGLGSTLLLADELRPHFARISQTLRSQPTGDGDVYTTSTLFEDDQDRDTSEPTGQLDMNLGAADWGDFDVDAFDTLDSSLDGFDSSFDSSADGGGDGGDGGDGGGGD